MKDIGLILGIRPDVIRASKVIKLLHENNDIDFDFIWSGQHYSENMKDVFFNQLNVPVPDYEFNIDIKNYVVAKPGVYSVNVKIDKSKKIFKGIANLGFRPTFNQKKILLEVNLFNFSGNLYNKKLSVEFLKFIRGEKKFKGIDELRSQIKIDLLKAKKIK